MIDLDEMRAYAFSLAGLKGGQIIYQMADEIEKLMKERDKLQHDLDAAVGYKLAVAEETRGDHGYEE